MIQRPKNNYRILALMGLEASASLYQPYR